MAKFRVTVFDPILLLAQMLAMQAAFYLVAGMLAAVFSRLLGASSASLAVLFDFRLLRTDNAVGWLTAAAFLASAASGGVVLLVLVGRSKQCFDFAATLHGFHLLACVVYAGWPRTVFWWALNITSLIVMAVLGEYLCMQRELAPITLAGQDLSRPAAGSASSRSGSGPAAHAAADEIEMVDLRPPALADARV